MNKIFYFLVALFAMTVVSCSKDDDNNNGDAEIARVKAAAVGTWEGDVTSLLGRTETVTVTFTEKKIETSQEFSANIVKWYTVQGNVYIQLDDEMKTNIGIKVKGNTMNLTGDSQLMIDLPATLTKKQ